ncbi:hypothetical protein ACFWIY_15125 [Streptomyces sioyaensis]|uniref:hypothetical protein n=1 Tax=Streptomyces sioyaensis TaxID=67364 RepID=UPI003667131F
MSRQVLSQSMSAGSAVQRLIRSWTSPKNRIQSRAEWGCAAGAHSAFLVSSSA